MSWKPPTDVDGFSIAEQVRKALVQRAIEAYDDAAVQGLCCEGAWEAAVSAMRRMNLVPTAGDRPTADRPPRQSGPAEVGAGVLPAPIHIEITADRVRIGGFSTTCLASPDVGGGAYALLEHVLAPGLLGAPPHRHSREDEVSLVLEGRLTVWRAGVVTEADAGQVVAKPRGEWHTFWNGSSEQVRFLEVISPPAFGEYFRDLATLIAAEGVDPHRIGALAGGYGLEFDFAALEPLLQRYHLHLG